MLFSLGLIKTNRGVRNHPERRRGTNWVTLVTWLLPRLPTGLFLAPARNKQGVSQPKNLTPNLTWETSTVLTNLSLFNRVAKLSFLVVHRDSSWVATLQSTCGKDPFRPLSGTDLPRLPAPTSTRTMPSNWRAGLLCALGGGLRRWFRGGSAKCCWPLPGSRAWSKPGCSSLILRCVGNSRCLSFGNLQGLSHGTACDCGFHDRQSSQVTHHCVIWFPASQCSDRILIDSRTEGR